MAIYTISERGGGRETFRSPNWNKAVETAKEWVEGGDYEESCYVQIYLCELDDSNRVTKSDNLEILVVREPEVPHCSNKEGHSWAAPHELIGGSAGAPGVLSLGGTQTASRTVCEHCGAYRLNISESTPGTYPKEPAITRYKTADEASLQWITGRLAAA